VRILVAAVLSIGLASVSTAEVSVHVFRCDGKTPVPLADPNVPGAYAGIMVGTRLVLVVSSDAGGEWWGGVQSTWDNWERGQLAGRGFDPNSPTLTYKDSVLPAAGLRPTVAFLDSPEGVGFELTSYKDAVPGDWFVLDYHAVKIGAPSTGLFDYVIDYFTPQKVLSFTHVPTRDFKTDTIVNFKDFALLASQWRQATLPEPNELSPYDLDVDRFIGVEDIERFSDYWLERTDCNEPPPPAAGS
jgi:hypothetical protein